jgi:hypothetical protein
MVQQRNFLRAALCSALLSVSFAAIADSDDIPINNGSELLDWCRQESEARFVGAGKQAYNWTARHVERGNLLVVEGKWRVEGNDLAVECRVARGARREYATMDLGAG